MEKGATTNILFQKLGALIPPPLLKCLLWLYPKVFLSFALVGFELYHYSTIMYLYKSLYFVCPVVAALVMVSNAFLGVPEEKIKAI